MASRSERIFNYPLYSLKRLPKLLKYNRLDANELCERGWAKNPLFTQVDMLWCNFRYGAMGKDYVLFEFWKKSASERDSFFTARRYYRFIKGFDKDLFLTLCDKDAMYVVYKDFIKRDWMIVRDGISPNDVRFFVSNNPDVLAKPASGEQGHGIKVLKESEIDYIIEETKKGASFVLEKIISNHLVLKAINPTSLNTYRLFTTVSKDGQVHIIGALLRCGASGQVVDNWGSGGVCYPIDLSTGIVSKPGRDKKGNEFILHPVTNTQVVGLKMPFFFDACELAKRIIEKDRRVCYAGLDIAATQEGLELIEVNFPGGHDILQGVDQVGKYNSIKSTV